MARIENLRLADAGRRRDATFTVRGSVVWEESDASRNEAELRVSFFGQDPRHDDRLANNVVRIVKGKSERSEEGDHSAWTVTAAGPDRTDFSLVRENDSTWAWRRRFNEDRPGRDEVYALAVVRDRSDGTNISESVRSNTVTGRY